MEQLAKFFPINNRVDKSNVVSLVITIVIYVVLPTILGIVTGILGGILGAIPVLGGLVLLVLSIISSLIGIYCLVGIILAIVKFVK